MKEAMIKELIPTYVPTPSEVLELRNTLELSQHKFADLFNLSYRTIQRAEYGETQLNPYTWEFMRQIADVVLKETKQPVAGQRVVVPQPVVAPQPVNSVNKVADVSDIDDWISSKLSF